MAKCPRLYFITRPTTLHSFGERRTNRSAIGCELVSPSNKRMVPIGRVSLARENEAGAVGGRKSIFSMLTYRTFCF